MNTYPVQTTIKKTGKFIYVLVFLAILLITSAVLRLLTPDTSTAENSWQEITPGKTSVDGVKEKLGEPINVVQYNEYSVLEYESPYSTMPHEVAIDKNNLVVFIKEFLSYDKAHLIDQYFEKYNQADLSLYAPMISDAVKAHVFLKEGLVVIAHIKGTVEQKWYFTPTDEQTFIKSWERELSLQQSGPEKFTGN